jgi:hypothetical protein
MKYKALKLALAAASALTFASGIHGQAPAAPAEKAASTAALPSADEVIRKYDAALGGRAAWEKLHSRVSKGTIEIPALNNLSGTIEVHMKAPDSILVTINLAGAVIRQGFDGTTAWSDDPRNGLRTLSGGELEDEKREANFYHALDLQKIYPKMVVTGVEKVRDQDAYVIEATPIAGGENDKLYFDTGSGLLVRSVNHRHTPDGVAEFEAEIEDYKDIDGIKLPGKVEQKSAQSGFVITFTDMQHNVNLSDSQFTKPAEEPATTPTPPAPGPSTDR